MKATIDAVGRIVVPKPMREAVRLRPGAQVELRVVGGHIEIEPAPMAIKLQRRGSLTVAVAVSRTRPQTAAEVAAATEEVRSDRDTSGRSSR
ncbi:MAG: AbrB/MazE/SpoVT family DNA-binding domain-containing protein [Vicinamibacteria bacterium]